MIILHIIHGFPPHYMAGSEIYTHTIAKEQAKEHQVFVFSRIESPLKPRYRVEKEVTDNMTIIRINNPETRGSFLNKYIDKSVDAAFAQILDEIQPDILHIGHLSHLSSNLVAVAKARELPIVFTLHDFWLLCQRGQLITRDLTHCNGPSDTGCAECFQGYLELADAKAEVRKRNAHLIRMARMLDLFIAPSRFLEGIFLKAGFPRDRIIYSDYGFDTRLFANFKRTPSNHLRVGYIGRCTVTKGLHVLIKAFNKLEAVDVELKIYCQYNELTPYLEEMIKNPQIHMMGPFHHDHIATVLSELDALVVPSLWYENSPLVIHEAALAKIPVIASNLGGMAEYVQHNYNGLLFEVGNAKDLANQIQRLIEDRELCERLGKNGVKVKRVEDHVSELVELYEHLKRKNST